MNHISEALRDWAWHIGSHPDYIGSHWLNTDYDSWEVNPHYVGVDTCHPESGCECEDGCVAEAGYRAEARLARRNPTPVVTDFADDDIPF